MVLEAAMAEFGAHGLHGGTVEAIARRVGVSQPYLFHLFGTKKALFLAAIALGFARTREAFADAVRGLPQDEPHSTEVVLLAMGQAYGRLLRDRTLLQLQLQAYVSCDDPEVRVVVRDWFMGLQAYVASASGADEAAIQDFFAIGMLMNVGASIDAASINENWARLLCPEVSA